MGREREVETVEELIALNRLVTLTGAGGVGKTRLALEVGGALLDQYADGVWLVELAPIADAGLVADTAVMALGLRPEIRPATEVLVDHLRDKQALLVLDNCEHLISACAELAETLLRACPQLRILATSREALNIAGETRWRVPSLASAEASQLFEERARAMCPGFVVNERNAAVIAQICVRLDGIPLAIELAASRLQGLTPAEIAAHLDDRFSLLVGGQRTAQPRHRTLRATLDWSYDLLSEPERVLLRRLSVFAGGWTAEAAEAVCADGSASDLLPLASSLLLLASDILPLLLSLVDKSLVVAEQYADADAAGRHTRYRMLETVRQYAAGKLAEAGDAEVAQARSRHLDYYLTLAKQSEPYLSERKIGSTRMNSGWITSGLPWPGA